MIEFLEVSIVTNDVRRSSQTRDSIWNRSAFSSFKLSSGSDGRRSSQTGELIRDQPAFLDFGSNSSYNSWKRTES